MTDGLKFVALGEIHPYLGFKFIVDLGVGKLLFIKK
jgi:hypothetical protein